MASPDSRYSDDESQGSEIMKVPETVPTLHADLGFQHTIVGKPSPAFVQPRTGPFLMQKSPSSQSKAAGPLVALAELTKSIAQAQHNPEIAQRMGLFQGSSEPNLQRVNENVTNTNPAACPFPARAPSSSDSNSSLEHSIEPAFVQLPAHRGCHRGPAPGSEGLFGACSRLLTASAGPPVAPAPEQVPKLTISDWLPAGKLTSDDSLPKHVFTIEMERAAEERLAALELRASAEEAERKAAAYAHEAARLRSCLEMTEWSTQPMNMDTVGSPGGFQLGTGNAGVCPAWGRYRM